MNVSPEEVIAILGAVGQVLGFLNRISSAAGATWNAADIAAVQGETARLHAQIARDLLGSSAPAAPATFAG